MRLALHSKPGTGQRIRVDHDLAHVPPREQRLESVPEGVDPVEVCLSHLHLAIFRPPCHVLKEGASLAR